MEWLAYSSVIVPLIIYILVFTYQLVISFLRLSKVYRDKNNQSYVPKNWELINVLLFCSLAVFYIVFNDAIIEVIEKATLPLFLAGVAFSARVVLYAYIFYIVPTRKLRPVWDSLFAISHAILLISIMWVATAIARIIADNPVQLVTNLLPIVVPSILIFITASVLIIWPPRHNK